MTLAIELIKSVRTQDEEAGKKAHKGRASTSQTHSDIVKNSILNAQENQKIIVKKFLLINYKLINANWFLESRYYFHMVQHQHLSVALCTDLHICLLQLSDNYPTKYMIISNQTITQISLLQLSASRQNSSSRSLGQLCVTIMVVWF